MDGERAQLDPRVATVLAAAAAAAEVPLPGEAAAAAAFRRVHARRLRRPRLSVTGRVAVAGGLGGLLMAGGVAAAATGAHRRAASTPAPSAPPAPAGWTHFRLHH
jgi:hypothetical protein